MILLAWDSGYITYLNWKACEEGVLVSDNQLSLYGMGRTVQEAVRDYISMSKDTFQELIGSEAVLSGHLCQQLEVLRGYWA